MRDKHKILVVEDDESTRKLIGLSLAESDYEVFEASSGSDALQILETNSVDGVITDYNMPGMNGVELTRLLRCDHRWDDVPIVMVSCYFTNNCIAEAKRAGVIQCLRKPFRRQHLQNIVSGVIPQSYQS